MRCTTETQGLRLEYAYSIPSVLENFWLQGRPEFARPEVWLDSFTLEGPVMEAWPPPAHARLLPESPLRTSDERAYVREVLARFMAQAYRRPVQAAEIDDKLALFDQARTSTGSLVRAIKAPLTAVLASPHFLYLVEPAGAAGDRPRPLDGHELAARLSYFLWSTQPDAELTRLAQDGTLSRREVLAAQVERLLRAPRSRALADHFAAQWLGLREVGANPPAPDLYPQYDRHLEASIIEEGKAFFDEVLRHDLSVLSFIRSDFVVINERLARFYGIPGVKGDAFRRVALPPDVQRGGVATMPAMLTITSNGTRTSPVKRGVWLMRNLLGIDPGLPVANVGDIKPKVPGIDKATVRQRLAAHRELPQCARCHDRIDPLGFALENFNAAGEWRDQEGFGYKGRVQKNDPKIDASARLPDGTSFTGVRGLMDELLRKEDLFLHALASKLFTYALGREMGIADQPAIKAAVEQAKRDGRTLRALIQAIVQSDAFRTK